MKNAKAGAEFESDEDEDNQGGFEIGSGKVVDVNTKKRRDQEAKEIQNKGNFDWGSLTDPKKT